MERTKEKGAEGKIRWRKTGGGTLYLGGRTIKSGKVFWAYPEEIPKDFRDVVRPVDDLPSPDPVHARTSFEVRSKAGGWFDVVDTVSGKAINEKSLRQEEATALLRTLA